MTFPASDRDPTGLTASEEDAQENWADIWALEDPAISGAADPADDGDGEVASAQ